MLRHNIRALLFLVFHKYIPGRYSLLQKGIDETNETFCKGRVQKVGA